MSASCCHQNDSSNLSCTQDNALQYYDIDPEYMQSYKAPTALSFTLALYLFLATVVHEWKNRRRKRKTLSRRIVPFSIGVCFLYSVYTMIDLFYGNVGRIACQAFHWWGTACYCSGNCLVYTILWSRQRKFYSDPLLKHTRSNKVRAISRGIIFAIYTLFGVICVSFEFTYCVIGSDAGCITVWQTHISVVVISMVFIVGCSLLQMILLVLIAYPFLNADAGGMCNLLANLCKPSTCDVEAMLKRLLLCAGICVITTQTAGMLIVCDALNLIRFYWPSALQFDMLVNNMAIIFTFVDWKQHLWLLSEAPLRSAEPFSETVVPL